MEDIIKEERAVELVATNGEAGIISASTPKETTDELLKMADEIEGRVNAFNKIKTAMLRLALPGDWVIFSDGDKKAVGELTAGGALRIASAVGISFTNWEARKEEGEDDKGKWYRWEFECDAVFKNRIIRVYGRAGSRDKFFGKAHGQLKPISDISEGDIKMAARRAAMKEGVKTLLGLHHLPASELEKIGVKTIDAQGWRFNNNKQNSDSNSSPASTTADTTTSEDTTASKEAKMRGEIQQKLIELAGSKWADLLKELSSFVAKDGKKVEGVSKLEELKGKWLSFTYKKIKDYYEVYGNNKEELLK